jgi:hypothetical protein
VQKNLVWCGYSKHDFLYLLLDSRISGISESSTNSDESDDSETKKANIDEFNTITERLEEISNRHDEFKGDFESEEYLELTQIIHEMKHKLRMLRITARGSVRTKCKECMIQLIQFSTKLEQIAYDEVPTFPFIWWLIHGLSIST